MAVSDQQFEHLLRVKLGDEWERAHKVFENYGSDLSFDVTNVLLRAAEREKVVEVLEILEEHYERHLQFQHPMIRDAVSNRLLGANPTTRMFENISVVTLGIKPTED